MCIMYMQVYSGIVEICAIQYLNKTIQGLLSLQELFTEMRYSLKMPYVTLEKYVISVIWQSYRTIKSYCTNEGQCS